MSVKHPEPTELNLQVTESGETKAPLRPTPHAFARHYLTMAGEWSGRPPVGQQAMLMPALLASLATSSSAEALVFTLRALLNELRARVADDERELAMDEAREPSEQRTKWINMGRFKVRHSRTAVRVAEELLGRAEQVERYWLVEFNTSWADPVATTEAATDEELARGGQP